MKKLLFLTLVAFALQGCSLGQMLRVPTGPNAPGKWLGPDALIDSVVFRGVAAGACAPVETTVPANTESGVVSVRAACILPVAVQGSPQYRQIFCDGPLLEKCREWGQMPNGYEISFKGRTATTYSGVYMPADKDSVKGRKI